MSATQHNDRYGRIAGLIKLDALPGRRVTIIGLGSMGQPIGDQMVRHGVATRSPGWLRVIDGDHVRERNFLGTGYRPEHVGMSKAEATVRMMREINPDVNVTYWHRRLTDADIPVIVDLASRSDLLGLFADSFDLMLRIADRCSQVCPQVMAIFGPNADFAEVAFSLPNDTPPLSRTIGRRKREAIGSPSAFGCDTMYVASFVAALCLELLLDQSDRGRLVRCYADAPLCIAGLRKAWVFADDPDDVIRLGTAVHV